MRITFKDVKTTLGVDETYDIMNAIRNSSSSMFKEYVPLANADNVAEVGAGILINQSLQNEFITALVDRIAKVVVRHITLNNPLKPFKKGALPLGRKIEEIFTDITTAKKYDPEDAEKTVFKREIPNVKTLFHEVNRQDFYKQTIQDESLKAAFVSWGDFEGFVSSIIQAIYNSAELDEYKYMKMIVDNYYSKGLFTVVPVQKPDTETTAKEFIKKLRATATKMTLPMGSRDFNALAVHTRTTPDNLHLLIDADLEAQVDVDVLAKAFNMDKTNFLGHVTVIDGFASTGLEAVLIDYDFYMVYDRLHHMETTRNAQGLYWNYVYHVWQVLSASRFANAVAFVSGDVPPVTQVIVDPAIAAIKQGRTFEFKAFVKQTVDGSFPVTWAVKANGGTTLDAATTIDSKGVLTVAATQTGELTVTATAQYTTKDDEGNDTTVDVVGESIVTVIPAT